MRSLSLFLFPAFILLLFPGGGARPQASKPAPGNSRKEIARALEKGLAWIASHQNPNGSWGLKGGVMSYTLVCGLALLAEGSSTRKGKYKDAIRRFLGFVLARLRPDGSFKKDRTMETWIASFASLALAEIYLRDRLKGLKKPLQALSRRLQELQVSSGGWFHGSVPMANYSSDMVAATNLAVLALHALGKAGFPATKKCLEAAFRYYQRLQNADGGFAYGIGHPMKELMLSAGGRTAVACLALACLGKEKSREYKKAAAFVDRHFKTILRGKVHGVFAQYFWLSGLACRHMGGSRWKGFAEWVLPALPRCQDPDGRFQLKRFSGLVSFGCPYYETPMAVLALLVPRDTFTWASIP